MNATTSHYTELPVNDPLDVDSQNKSYLGIRFVKIGPLGIDPFIKEIQDITNNGFGMGEFMTMTVEDFREETDIILFFIDKKLIGFLSTKLLNNVICINMVAIRKEYQGMGIFSSINQIFFSQTTDLVLRTQNMNIIKAYRKLGRSVSVGREALDICLQKLGNSDNIAKLVGGENQQPVDDNGIFKGAFGSYLGEDGYVTRISESDYSGFDASKGDALLVHITIPE